MALSEKQDLANRIFSLTTAATGISTTWAIYLIDPSLDYEPELRNKAFAVMIAGLMDAGHEFESRLNGLHVRAKKLQCNRAIQYLEMIDAYLRLVSDLLNAISREEAIFVTEIRHQVVHGNHTEIHRDARTIRYAAAGRILAERISADEYWECYRRVLADGSVDSAIEPIRERFSYRPTWFWSVDRILGSLLVQRHISEDLQSDGPECQPRVVLRIPPADLRPAAGSNDAFATLMDMRGRLPDQERRRDPVVAS